MLDRIIHEVVHAFNGARPFATASFIGEKYIAQNDTPPRLVWIPTSDTFNPPVFVGANPKCYATRVAGVDCAVWGGKVAEAEEMANDLIVAIHEQCRSRGNYELRGAEWITAGEFMNNGVVYLLHLAFEIPVVGRPATVTRPETETQFVAITLPLGATDGEETDQ
jgi:hypothetical protein